LGIENDAVLNAISIDVEDYFHTEAMSPAAPRDSWEQFPARVEPMTERLLAIFAEYHVQATFFFLGWVAERYPQLVRQVVQQGHEIGCHSYWHRAIFRLSPSEFREDTQRAKDAIESAGGVRVRGYRAPSFSLVPGTEWAAEILADLGFSYDSSIHPIRHDFYSNAAAPRFPHRLASGAITELPIATIRLGDRNWPCGGGAYLRCFPISYFRWALHRLNTVEQQPAMLYLHPWEIDPDQPRLQVKLKSRLRQYSRLHRMEPNLRELLRAFRFGTVEQAFAHVISGQRVAAQA
jgi:polysaccharide deacetylase family protein (PEP-CTERM system associated)